MKKLFVSMGLVAASAASVQLAQADGVDSKVWSVSASLRGFYDDNYTTASHKVGSGGFEFSPSVSASVPLRQTDVGLRYVYGLYYYQDRDRQGEHPFDQSHQVDLWVDHAFSETWHGKVEDSLTVGQEPQLSPQGSGGTLRRVNGDNIANTGSLGLTTDWTREFSTDIGYQNHLYDYDQSGWQQSGPGQPSLAGLLNRDENDANIDLDYNYSAHTTFLVGYQFGDIDYNGNETIGSALGVNVTSRSRDSISHYGYAGLKMDLLSNLRVEGKAGIQYIDYIHSDYAPGLSKSTTTSPYVDISATYTYLAGSYLQVGFTQSRNAVDLATFDSSGRITQDQETSLLYGSINHEITSKLVASIIGDWQYATFHQGAFNDSSDTYYNLGLSLTYSITKHFAADLGYNYDNLSSSVPGRGYERNRVYIGLNATY